MWGRVFREHREKFVSLVKGSGHDEMSKTQSDVDQVLIRKADTRARAGSAHPGRTESSGFLVSQA